MQSVFKRYWSLLATYLAPQRRRVTWLVVLLGSNIGLQLVNPQIIRGFIDATQRNAPQTLVLGAASLYIGLAFTQRAVALGSTYVAENVGWTATNQLRADLTLHCLQLDMDFHKNHLPGELIERIDGDVTALANFFGQLVVQVIGNLLLVLGILLFLLREDWRIGVGIALYSLVTLLVLGALQRLAVDWWRREREASAEHFGFLEDRLGGTEDIRANGGEEYVLHRLYGLMRRMLETNRSARLVSNVAFIGTNFLLVVGYSSGLALGVLLYTRSQVTIGTTYLIVFYIGMLFVPLESIRSQVADLQKATASIDRIDELRGHTAHVHGAAQSSTNKLSLGPLAVAFDAVSFGYTAGEPVLSDVSFQLAPGQVLGLLGRTGSGKTTLTRLLFRLYDPTKGRISVAGTELYTLPLAELRSHVGMVTQDVQLFRASIRDNLTFFKSGIADAELERVLIELGLGPWLHSLPAGLDTVLQAGGQGLSAGQAQLLAFARIFLRDPGLVILDEASSRLDPVSEQLLERAIDRLLQDRTAIIIAHRLETVARADAIMILDGGQVVEYGPRKLLAHDPSSRLYQLLQTGLEEALV